MNKGLQELFKYLWKSALFWGFAFVSLAIFRYFGLNQEISQATGQNISSTPIEVPFIIATAIGLVLGILFGLINFFFDKSIAQKVSLGFNILLKTLSHFLATVFTLTLILTLLSKIFPLNINLAPGWWLTNRRFWAAMWFIVLSSVVFSFVKIATERFGRGVFLKMLLGHYKTPQEENRVFMFLDLKNSTSIAEELGYHKYSQFIQDCFSDLNEVVIDYNAEIYQYVGDEAVLSWSYEKGLLNNNCIGIFFAFEAQRQQKKDYYQKKYNIFPEFKAGLHGGKLMVAEVGSVKKELAYHGDVINTSARIQAECNAYNTTLLISEKLLKDLQIDIQSKFLGNILLKGKQNEVKIHSVESML